MKKFKSQISDASPERISSLSESLSESFDTSLQEIHNINLKTRLLSFNAQIEAARAGEVGACFSVVAAEMQKLSSITEEVAKQLETEAETTVNELKEISQLMATNVRGTRLSDLALVNIDLIDRNLYERTCDVRWWATDSAVVSALAEDDIMAKEFACKRLGIILDAYTVYYDIVLCDKDGTVVANGKPNKYTSIGDNVSNTDWFSQVQNASNGDEYGFQSVTKDSLVNGALTLTYSCGVFDENGKNIGVLGVLFNWEALAQVIVKDTPVESTQKEKTRCCIVDVNCKVLADSHDNVLSSITDFGGLEKLMQEKKAFVRVKQGKRQFYIAHAAAPGYETYSTGWHSLLIQEQ
ncbi:methyl-accepting chemotaxis protein [Puniceicoccaceae bacterium K14]|nr:methyl-accepting chemotaxis protein [Puniceicoccaceae bacterium K14]